MKHFSILLLVALFISTPLSAATPFTLTGLKKMSIVAESMSPIVKEPLLDELKSMMAKKLDELKVTHKGYFNEIFALRVDTQNVQDVTLLKLELLIGSQVKRNGEGELVFGITYMIRDSVEVEDLKTDAKESLEFLLSEFSDQYIEENKE